jgi:hypothetical protein
MATLTLTAVWVNLVATGQAVSGVSGRGRAESYEYPGEVRTYAGGRRRSITSAGELGSYGVSLFNVPRSTVETLRTWAGQTVQVRDNTGRRFVGVFFKVDVADPPPGLSLWDCSFALNVVTYAEAV